MADLEVFLTLDAEKDLEDIVAYIETHDSLEKADYVYERIKKSILGLERLPNRGRIVPELKEIGILEYREIFFKPYRILYFTIPAKVYVVAIFDGRRDSEDVILRRFLR